MAKKIRVNFRLPDGRRGVTFCQTQAEANLTKSMVGALIAAVHSGIVNQDALIWASRLPADHYQKLVRWGLLTERSVGITVTKLIDFVLKQKKADKTKYNYNNVGRRLISFFGGGRDIRTISRADAESFCRLLTQSVSSAGKQIKPSSAKQFLQTVKYIFNEAVRVGWLDFNPFIVTQISSDIDKTEWVYISKDDVLRVLENVTDPELKSMIALMRFAGVRGQSEFSSMTWTPETIRWKSIDQQCSISITSPKLQHHAAKYWRTVPLPEFVERILSEWFWNRPDGEKRMFGVLGAVRSDINKIVRTFRENGIEIYRPYNLRRSFCCDIMEAVGSDASMYEAICGHSFSIGMKHYQLIHNNRRQNAEQKVIDFWTRSEATTPFTTPQQPETAGNSQQSVTAKNAEYT